MAEEKIADARLLLNHGRWANSYYLGGYAVELALKACISRGFETDVVPDKAFATGLWVHNLRNLVNLSGLDLDLQQRQQNDPDFRINWAIVASWLPDTRYAISPQQDAEDLLEAIDNNANGVLPWIRQHW